MQRTGNQVSTSTADASLIALCAEYCRLEERAADDELIVEAWDDDAMTERRELARCIAAAPCTTLEGARALARAYVASTNGAGDADGPDAYPEDRLLGALLRGLTHGEDHR